MKREVYAVLGLFKNFDVDNNKGVFPDGQYAIPVYDKYDDALKIAAGKFDIVKFLVPEIDDQTK